MKSARFIATMVACISLFAASWPARSDTGKAIHHHELQSDAVPKSATVDSLAARATVSPSGTVYGGFGLATASTVYILVRGPSLTVLGVTPNSLDAPWVRLYNASGTDIVSSGGRVGFTSCLASASTDRPVVDYYQTVRNAPVHSRDSCIATNLPAGAYTFSVTPSIPGSTSPADVSSSPSTGEILFEVTLGPAGGGNNNRTKAEQLLGGTWTLNYSIGSSRFSSTYSFTSVQASTATPGDYAAVGRDNLGDLVVGTYVSRNNVWAILDPSILLDRFYTFTFSDLNHISGCYYQITPSGSTNVGSCYPMTGLRSPFKSLPLPGNPMTQELDQLAAAARNLEGAGATGEDASELHKRLLQQLNEMRARAVPQ